MVRPMVKRAVRIAIAAALVSTPPACDRPEQEPAVVDGDTATTLTGALPGGVTAPPPDELPEAGPIPRDLEIFHETLEYARSERLDTLPFGETVVRVGRRFVGEPYTPGTLEQDGIMVARPQRP